MFDCCATSRECCGNSVRTKKNRKINPVTLMKCAYVKCSNTITYNRLTEWKTAIAGPTMFRFCCDDCWNKWLVAIKHQNPLYSPILVFSLESPGTPAIEPRTILDEIPLLHI